MSIEELSEKVLEGMTIALKKLAESSAAKNKSLVVEDKDGIVRRVPAKELLLELQQR